MSGRAEEIFHRLTSAPAILSLIGQSEDAHFDCKEWPTNEQEAQKVFAKAACGLTNAEGGVLVVGMRARKAPAEDEPDLVESAAPVADTSAVKSKILDLIGQLVEPGIEGVQAAEISESAGSKSGFVAVYIPASEGSPRRSRKDWKFYLRIGSSTLPMEYFQIADMFGKRPQPKLELYLELTGEIGSGPIDDPVLYRYIWLGLSNTGRGLAKFPSVRFKRDCGLGLNHFGLDGNGNVGLPLLPSDPDWIIFRGGVDDVVYSGTTLKITRLMQRYSRGDPRKKSVFFDPVTFKAEVSAEGILTLTVEKTLRAG
jgi:Putative DNA-binding domain